MREYLITASWDDKECVWTATSYDVKGLCLEAANLDDIIQEAQRLIPELLVLNGQDSIGRIIFMTDEELKQLVANLAVAQQKTDRQLQELGKQIGGLGEKFGSFTEGMAFPSVKKVLYGQFGMDAVATRYRIRKNGQTMELDVFAYRNGTVQQAIIVEVKSHLREEHIDRMLTLLSTAKEFLPEHAAKSFYGILAVVDSPEQLKTQVLNQGIYYAEIHDDIVGVHSQNMTNKKST